MTPDVQRCLRLYSQDIHLRRHTSHKTHIRVLAAPCASELFNSFHPLQTRAQGRPGASWRLRSACSKKARGRTTGAAGITRPSPRDGFTSYTCSPRGPALLPPSPARSSHRRLGISTGMPGPHAFDVRTGLFVGADQPRCNPARPPHPASTSVTIAKRPSCEAGCGQRTTISEKKKVIFCCWTARQT